MENQEGQIELFEDEVDLSIKNTASVVLDGNQRCSQCQHILGVHFSSNLYFCSIQKQYGGHYGKKIKKSQSACFQFKPCTSNTLDLIDGRYGGLYRQVNR